MERQPRKTTLRDVEEGAEVTLLAMVVPTIPSASRRSCGSPTGHRRGSRGPTTRFSWPQGPHRVRGRLGVTAYVSVASRGLTFEPRAGFGPLGWSLAARHGSAADGLAQVGEAGSA